ncbi:MAG TPA: hypothetical protein VLB87_10005 [Pyrinomonadaceae bacterium]|nr:hypothetical protein [Pyrinomonadaceae bacterium]
MAEERTLGLARAHEPTAEEPSKQELQRRLDEARDSISHTVTEIKESVASQVQAVKESLDWREQFRKRPVAWSAGAAGVGFLVGYGLAAMVKGDSGESYASSYSSGTDRDYADEYAGESKSYAAQPILHARSAASESYKQANGKQHEGPGFFEKLTSTPAYHKVKHEAGNIGDAVMHELSNTAKTVVLPALMTSLRNFIGGYLPNAQTTGGTQSQTSSSMRNEADRARSGTGSGSAYYPSLERDQV